MCCETARGGNFLWLVGLTVVFLFSPILMNQLGATQFYVENESARGVLDERGNLTKKDWEGFSTFKRGKYYQVKVNGKWGLVNSKLEMVQEPKWDVIFSLTKYGYARVKVGNLWGIIDAEGKEVVPCKWEKIEELPVENSAIVFHDLFVFTHGGKRGVSHIDGTIVLKPEWRMVQLSKECPVIIANEGRRSVVFGLEGKQVRTTEKGEFRFCGNRFSIYSLQTNKIMILNQNGSLFHKKGWDRVRYCPVTGGFLVCENRLWGYLDEKGVLVCPPKWNHIGSRASYIKNTFLKTKKVLVWKSMTQVGIMDSKGKVILEPEKQGLNFTDQDAYITVKEGKSRLLSLDKRDLLGEGWTHISHAFPNGNRVGMKNGEHFLISPQFKLKKLDLVGKPHGFFAPSYIEYKDGEKYGLVGSDGKVVIPAVYDEIKSQAHYTQRRNHRKENAIYFREGIGVVKLEGKWGAVSDSGRILVKPEWKHVYVDDMEAPAVIGVSGEEGRGLFSENGEMLVKPAWLNVGRLGSVYYVREAKSMKWGILGKGGKLISKLEWDRMVAIR